MYSIDTHKVIYNGIDTKVFSPDSSIETIDQSIFYFGTLSDAKGVNTLAKTFNEVVKLYPKATLHLIGKGKAYWDYLCEHVLSGDAKKQTTYYGTKQLYELPKLLCKANLICLPTNGETFAILPTCHGTNRNPQGSVGRAVAPLSAPTCKILCSNIFQNSRREPAR